MRTMSPPKYAPLGNMRWMTNAPVSELSYYFKCAESLNTVFGVVWPAKIHNNTVYRPYVGIMVDPEIGLLKFLDALESTGIRDIWDKRLEGDDAE